MIFPTVEFAVFFALVLVISWILMPRRAAWKLFILVASYTFYGFTDYRWCLLLLASTVFNQVMAVLIHRAAAELVRARLLAVAVVGNLAVLGWFKYYGFFVDSVAGSLSAIGVRPPLPLLQVALPVGISFFTFQALSYVIDVRRRELSPAPAVDFAVYLAFFPHLVAGPIVRAVEFLPQLRRPRDPLDLPAARAFRLIVGGLIKKIVIADVLASSLVDSVFTTPGQHSRVEILVGIYGYAVQIYCDFSAYSDIAIGVALLLGFRFPENFNAPYTAVSLQDFWRRWHMTLSRWLRDYLYIPLGGGRGGEWRTRRNLLITMLLGGLWHGAAWQFVLWGGLHGGGLAVERAWAVRRASLAHSRHEGVAAGGLPEGVSAEAGEQESAGRHQEPLHSSPLRRAVARVATFHFVCFAWMFFRADSVGTVFEMVGRLMTAGGPSPAVTRGVLAAIVVGIAAQYLPRNMWERVEFGFSRLGLAPQAAALGMGVVLVDALGSQGVAPFIYFQF